MTPQEAYDRINMLGYLLYHAEREMAGVEADGRQSGKRYRELERITSDHLIPDILHLARNIHWLADPHTPAGKQAAESLLKGMENDGMEDYAIEDGRIVYRPEEPACEPVLEEYFKDIKINGEYLCDRQAGRRVSRNYRANGRPRAVRSKE